MAYYCMLTYCAIGLTHAIFTIICVVNADYDSTMSEEVL